MVYFAMLSLAKAAREAFFTHMSKKNKGGRPTVMTPEVLSKLEDAFMNAFSDEMSCLYAGISTTALYEYCEKNPKFAERKEILKKTPDLVAQKTLVGDLKNTSGARWWAEKKMPEFMPKTKVEHSGSIATEGGQTAAQRAIADEYEKKLREDIAKGAV